MSNTSELISSEVRSQLSALAHVEPAKAELAVQLAGTAAAAEDDPARIAFLPAKPRLADGDRFRKDVRNFQSAQPTKYLFGPDTAGGQEYTKSEALAGVIVGRIRPGALRAEIERKRDLYEASIAGLERDRALLARLGLVPADLRTAEDEAAILALQQSCARDHATIVAVRDSYLRAPGLLATITAWIHETRPHAARRALTEPYTGEDPRSWHDWFMPLVQHTLPQGQRLAVYYAECLRTALEARSTSEDPEYQNLDVRMAGFAQANERTLRAFLAALQQRILAQDGALSPLQLDEIFVAACKTHGCRTVLPPTATAALEAPEAKKPRVRKLAPVAAAASDDDGDEPIEAVPVKSVNAAPGTKAPQGAPVAGRRHPDEERLGYPSTTTSHAPWIADKRARRRDRPAREEDAADERSEPGPTRGGFSHRGGHRQEPYARGGYRNDRGGFGRDRGGGYSRGGATRAPASGPNQRPLGRARRRAPRTTGRGGRGRGYGQDMNRGQRPRFNQVRAENEPRSDSPNSAAMAAFFQHLQVMQQQAALHESARGASSSSAGGNPNAGAPPGGPSIRSLSVHVMPVGTDSDSDEAAAVAAVRQPSDALAMAAKARDQAAFDAAAADISAGALDDATREAAFERDLRCANPASEDGSGESELGESDAERLDTDSESAPSSDPGQGSAPYASDTSKPAYFGPFGSPDRDVPQAPPRCSTKSWALDYMPYDHVPATDVEKEGEREGGPYLPRYVSPVLMPLTKWYAHLTAKPRDLERAIGLLFTNGLDDAKQTLLVRELAQEGPKGIALDRFLGACGLRRPERLLLGRLAHRTEAHSLACVIEAAATIAKLDYRLQEGPDSSIAMLAIRGAQLSHPVTKCSGIGSAPDPEDLWPDDPNELDVASLKAWDDMLLSWERHAPASNVWGLASDSSALPDSERLPLLSLLISSAYLLAQPGLKWPGIQHLQVEPNGDPRFDITPDGNVSRTVTGYHAMRTALAAARELLDEDSDFHAYCVQLVLAIIRFRTLTVLPGALGFEKGSLFAWISPKDVAPPLSLFQTYTERLTEVAGATCFDTRAKGTVPSALSPCKTAAALAAWPGSRRS
eukprot:tig00000147_g9439.t1